jgi:putative oxidoreductase
MSFAAFHHSDLAKLLMRFAVGGLMLFHGVHKLVAGVGGIEMMLMKAGLPAFMAYGVYVGEVIAPLMLLIGWRVEMAAVIIVVNMLFAIFLAHWGDIFSLSQHGAWAIELQMFYVLSALNIFFQGAGKYIFHRW